MDANTLLMVGGLAYSWWKSRTPDLTPEQAAPTIEVEPPDADVAVPSLTVHLVGESEAGKQDGMLLIAFPVSEVPETPALSGRRRGFGQTVPPPDVVARYRTIYQPSGPVRATVPRPPQRPAPGMVAPKPPKPTSLQAAMPVAGAVLAAIPLVQLGAAKLQGREVGVGQVITATGFTAAGIIGQFTSPLVGGAVSAGAHSVQYFSGNLNAASTAQYFGNLAKDGARMAQVVLPALGLSITAAVSFVQAFSDMDGPRFGQHIGQGLGALAGVAATLVGGPLAGLAVGMAGRWLGGKIGAWWDRRQAIAQAKAVEGITGASVDAMLAEQWATWGEQKQAADIKLAEQEAWWDTPPATVAYQAYVAREMDDAAAWNLPEPVVDDAAAWALPTPSDEILTAALTDEELAALGLTPEEIDIFRHGVEEWTGGFGVSQPEDEVVVAPMPEAPALVVEEPWDIRAQRGEVPLGIKLLGAWDALITDSNTVGMFGPAMFEWAAVNCRPGSGAKCRAVYIDGRTVDFFSTEIATVPGAPLAVIEQYAA